ncbi:ABC transporter ATP-binding protein [Salimicrobium halophilum]|uniref:Carnitine transport ATP-binding protein OpuCA n=1 Tax=Salimicrobium halophilum TaxID=86666 RepID=A0A1G8R343_9BACI|nr:ABC transporter ATP-binding protein [Salimicrobium halophilum]SDJ11387.1 iron(III) transport system ATP-binding protein [Salimicrobium halophilum]
MTSFIDVRDAEKCFSSSEVFGDVSFHIEEGEIFSIVGPSGSGKTTLLRCLAGLETFSGGSVHIDGEPVTDVKANARPISLVFQQPLLFPHMTVLENISYGLKFKHIKKKERLARASVFLGKVGMEKYGASYPHELSGGQRQRIALARSLVLSPKLLLLDEPFSSLDKKLREEMREWVRTLLKQQGITAIFVTHDQEEAVMMGDVIGVFKGGTFAQIGTPHSVYEHPATPDVAHFFGDNWVIDEDRYVPRRHLYLLKEKRDNLQQWPGVVSGKRLLHGIAFSQVDLDGKRTMIYDSTGFEEGAEVFVTMDPANIRTFQEKKSIG